MLFNAYSLAKIGADTAENERNFAEKLPKRLQIVLANFLDEQPAQRPLAKKDEYLDGFLKSIVLRFLLESGVT